MSPPTTGQRTLPADTMNTPERSHPARSGKTTWYEPVREVFRHLGADPGRVRPAGSAALPRPAPRPAYRAHAHDGRQQLAPPPRDRRTAQHEALPEIRKESL
jgi:dTDP-4-dehydrorhamnose reductase/4-ketoreductase